MYHSISETEQYISHRTVATLDNQGAKLTAKHYKRGLLGTLMMLSNLISKKNGDRKNHWKVKRVITLTKIT